MLTAEHPADTPKQGADAADCREIPLAQNIGKRVFVTLLAPFAALAIWLADRLRFNRTPHKLTSPGSALNGWRMKPEDAEMLRRVADPNDPAGKPSLRAGPAIRR